MGSNIDVFLATLPVMGWGMAGIFIVMTVIAIAITLLKKLLH